MRALLLLTAILGILGCKANNEEPGAGSGKCIMGQYRLNGECVSSLPGHFAPGDENQYKCPAGQFSENSAQIACSICKNKPENSSVVIYGESDSATTRFCPVDRISICSPSYRLQADECIPCANKPLNAQNSIFEPNAEQSTSACVLVSVICDAGYNLVGGVCVDNSPNPTNLETRGAPSVQTLIQSNVTTVNGINVPVQLVCHECSAIEVNGLPTALPATVEDGDTFILFWDGLVAINATKNIAYTFGSAVLNWRIFGLDSIPDRLEVETQGVTPSTLDEDDILQPTTVTSQPFTLTGFDVPVTLTCSGCASISVNGSLEASPAAVNPGDQIVFTYTGIVADGAVLRVPFTTGSTLDSWTLFAEDFPTPFKVLTDNSVNGPTLEAKSQTVFISGLNGEAQLFVSDAFNEASFAVNGGARGTYSVIRTGDTVVFYSRFGDFEEAKPVNVRIVRNNAERLLEWALVTRPGINCSLSGSDIDHGDTITAYDESSPILLCGLTFETRTCYDGALSGSKPSLTCQNPCANPFGGILRSGEAVTAYSTSTPARACSADAEVRTCVDGTLSGSNTIETCTEGCETTFGSIISDGSSATFWKEPVIESGGVCESEVRNCSNQQLTGSFSYGSCDDGCFTADNIKVPSGTSRTLYSEGAGLCNSTATVTCDKDGLDSPGFRYATCTPGCATPWGTTVPNGQSVTAYASPGPTFPCVSQTRTCNNYVLSGSYTNQSCISAPANCARPGGGAAIPHGGSITAYRDAVTLLCNGNPSETRTCYNGSLSGSYTNLNPSSRNCNCRAACPNGWHTDGRLVSYRFYPTNNLYQGTLTCSNGNWVGGGSYRYVVTNGAQGASCSPAANASGQ